MNHVCHSPAGVPMVMNASNFNRCAMELERLVDSLNVQIAAAIPGSSEDITLVCSRKKLVEVRDAFRVLACLNND